MIEIQNVEDIYGETHDHMIESDTDLIIDGSGLLLFPGLIDPHVHFRTPGHPEKESWHTASAASIKGGYTTVFDMPNTDPACTTEMILQEKKALIDQQLKECGIPLRYELYFGADKSHLDEIYKVKKQTVGLKVFMGSSTGDLLIDDPGHLHAVFALAKAHDLIVSVHAEDEALILERSKTIPSDSFHAHSKIRNEEVAYRSTKLAIDLAKLYGTRLCILHVTTAEELPLIKHAKEEGYEVFAETTPHHLFLNTDSYDRLGGKAQMNPPLRSKRHSDTLLQAIHDGVIDTIGSDHAPHTLEEKNKPYGQAPSGVPGIETTLPLLLNAYHNGLLSIEQIIDLTHTNPQDIFRLPPNNDVVLVDMNKEKVVREEDLKTKCGWSPFAGQTLKGWPVTTIVNGKVYHDSETS